MKDVLTLEVFLSLIKVFERRSFNVPSNGGHFIEGVPHWNLRRLVDVPLEALTPWLRVVGYASVIEADLFDGPKWIEVEYSEGVSKLGYKPFGTSQWQYVERSELAIFKLKRDELLGAIANLLDIGERDRQGIESPLIPDVLWRLGKARLNDDVQTLVYVARNIDLHSREIAWLLEHEKEPILILSADERVPVYSQWPESVSVRRLSDVVEPILIESNNKPHLDEVEIGEPEAEEELTPPLIEHDGNDIILQIPEKDPWRIRGKRQAQVVLYMHEQALKGRWVLPAKDLLMCGAKEMHRVSKQVSTLFSGSDVWKNYITSPTYGHYSFNMGAFAA